MAFGGIRAVAHAFFVVLSLASCAQLRRGSSQGPPPALPEPRRGVRTVPLPEWYWEPVEADAHAPPKAVELPVAESALVRVEGATRIWEALGAEGRDRLRRDGLVVLGSNDPPRVHMGAFYMGMREQRVPYVITLDALVYAVHVAFERALAEVDESVLAPELDGLLTKLEARLSAEQRGAGVEIGEALRLVRGIVAVARALASDATGAGVAAPSPAPASAPSPARASAPSPALASAPSPALASAPSPALASAPSPAPVPVPAAPVAAVLPSDLGPAVSQEIARIVAHAGVAESPLLGVPIDYARFAAPKSAGRPGSFRALAWLASAPLLLAPQSEVPGAVVGVAASRLNTRAAMLLSRVSDRETDPAIHAAWSRIARLLRFVWGPSDDLAPGELAELASAIGVTIEDPKHVANVITVDRLRRRAARGRQPLVFDGAGAPGRAGISLRLFGGHAPADSVALASLASATRPLPTTLDLAVWLGAPEARAALHEAGGDAAAGYETALARAIGARPGDEAPSRHASVYGSMLDVVMTWLTPREGAARGPSSPAVQRAAIESALAAWTFARHTGQPLSRPRPPRGARASKELDVTGAALPAFVESAPEVIAQLVATVRQMKRGLGAIGNLPATSPAMTALAEVDDILRFAMRVSSREANDDALSPEDVAALASLPARFARLEDQTDDGAMVPVVTEIMVDAAGERVLSSATGAVEPAVMIIHEPGTGRLVLAVGAHVAHHELVEPRAQKSTDASHRARFRAPEAGRESSPGSHQLREGHGIAGMPARASYTSTFRMVR